MWFTDCDGCGEMAFVSPADPSGVGCGKFCASCMNPDTKQPVVQASPPTVAEIVAARPWLTVG
jgi:hypothetical protein